MKKIIIILCFILIYIYTFSLSQNDFQFDLSQELISEVLREYIKSDKITDPEIIFKTDLFEFNAVSHLFVFSANISFKGSVKVISENIIHLNITDYYQSGKKQSKKNAIEKIQEILNSINNTDTEKKIKIHSKYIPSTEYTAIIELDISEFDFFPTLPDMKIKKITLNKNYISIASTKDMVIDRKNDLQAYIGENIINRVIGKYLISPDNQIKNISSIGIDIDKDKVSSLIFAKDKNNMTLWINLLLKLNTENRDNINIKIANSSIEDDSFDYTEVVETIIYLLNSNTESYKTEGKEKKPALVFNRPSNISMGFDFDNILPLYVKPVLTGISTGKDYILLYGNLRSEEL